MTELNNLEGQLEIEIGNGHHYTNPTSKVPMVELHVDSHPTFHAQMNATTQFGGNLSVRMPPDTKPLICFGQDECIFKQFLFTGKAWSAPDGTKPVIPKDEGLGVMISAFVSREFGFGMKVSAEDLQKVNECRQGKKYSDESAAMDKRGTSAKQPLKSSPFVVQFEYGINAEGYWTYDRMCLQIEVCIDVLQGLHPHYDYVFLFDHLCGHDRQRPDSLNHHTLNKGFRGGQTKMRSSKILRAASFLGQYEHPQKLKVGDNQQLVFLTLDQEGPFYPSTEQRATKMNHKSRESENRTKVKSKTELLVDELALKGVCPEDPKSLKKQEVLELAAHNDLQKSKQFTVDALRHLQTSV